LLLFFSEKRREAEEKRILFLWKNLLFCEGFFFSFVSKEKKQKKTAFFHYCRCGTKKLDNIYIEYGLDAPSKISQGEYV